MTREQWQSFCAFRDGFRSKCAEWSQEAEGWLGPLQIGAAEADRNPEYPLETPIVYNEALDLVTEGDEIRLLVIGDNPGKDEQLAKNRRYLVGQAGKLGAGFFRNNPELGVDFRKNALILNKTPIHTAKTKQLAWIARNGGAPFARLFSDTQAWMAEKTLELALALDCEIWLVGYGELREKGLFAEYAATLARAVTANGQPGAMARQAVAPVAQARALPGPALNAPAISQKILLFQHFSMNRFSIDLKERYNPAEDLKTNLLRVGLLHRREILGW